MWPDKHVATHRFSSEVHFADTGLCHGAFVILRTYPRHQRLLGYSNEHMPAKHEGYAAEHLALRNAALEAQSFSHALSKGFIVCHVLFPAD